VNYELWIAGDGGSIPDTVIGVIFREPWQRPAPGQEIQIKGKIFTILRCDPPSNPDNESVKYFVNKPNDNWPYKRKS
tara:strand:+ start:355 stop:585 length:231 start_codon:yes stop_codon:yes gene_type:complete